MANVILLSDSFVFGAYGATRYMGPYVIASQLEQAGISTLVIDYFTRHNDFFPYLEQFISDETLIVGISSTFLFPTSQIKSANRHRSEGLDNYYTGELFFNRGEDLLDWLNKLKATILKKNKNCKLVLGGVKAQFAHWRPYYYDPIDYLVLGPGDHVLIDAYKQLALEEKPKILTKMSDKILDQSQHQKRNASCPSCHFSNKLAILQAEPLPLEISRGCVYNCKFCHYEKKESSRKDLFALKDELIKNYELFGTTIYHLCDDCFNDSRKKVEDVCGVFLSLPFKIEWVSYARFDVAVKFPETADLMVESGAKGLYMGIESFDYKVALKAGKGTPPDKVKEFLINFKKKYKESCLVEGSFIVGLPGENIENLQETSDWLDQNDALDFATFGPLGLMPYTVNLDGLVFDYADYSRDPEKYGFKNVTFKPNYWEHDTMNSTQAKELAIEMVRRWRVQHPVSIMRTIWMYPHFRGLGFSQKEVFSFASPVPNQEVVSSLLKNKFQDRLSIYFQTLMNKNLGIQ